MWLLEYLISKAERVMEWFGGLYALGKIVILNVGYWLYDWAITAYNWAINYLYPQILYYYYLAHDLVLYYYYSGLAILYSIRNDIYYEIAVQIALAKAVAQLLYQAAIDLANSLYIAALDIIEAGRLSLMILIYEQIEIVIGLFSPLLGFVSFLLRLVSVFSEDNIAKFLDFLSNSYEHITLIVQNPLGYSLAILKPVIRAFLEYIFAYALGTLEADLPPWPDYLLGGDTPPESGGDPPPDVGDGLLSPLATLYISGYHYGEGHPGLDLGLTRGESVYAMHDGSVITSGWSSAGYGNQVVLQDGDWWTRYAHLESATVQAGQSVPAGAIIGLGNSTGNSTGDHLHLEIKYKGSYIDPATVLFG